MSKTECHSMEQMFRHNGHINSLILALLKPEELMLNDGNGGQSIFELMAHIASTRSWFVKSISPEMADSVQPTMRRDEHGQIHILVHTPAEILDILARRLGVDN